MTPAAELATKMCWVTAAAVAGFGYVAIVVPGESREADLGGRSEALLQRVAADERAVRDAGRLDGLRREINAELEGITLDTHRAAVIAEFLREVERRASARHVRLTSFQSRDGVGNTVPPPVAGSRSAPAGPLESISVELVLRGRYSAVLQTLADLSESRVLMQIQQSSIDRAKGGQEEDAPLLSLQLRLAVFYLRAAPAG